ncbi:hypothetical protein [Streptomyces sp. P9-A2]|uniref:hypothetical protein n=1 Tax=Streptomyces sp. P9-A2 TaxID=3072284 RepID=UPI002FC7C0CE
MRSVQRVFPVHDQMALPGSPVVAAGEACRFGVKGGNALGVAREGVVDADDRAVALLEAVPELLRCREPLDDDRASLGAPVVGRPDPDERR